MGDTVQECKQPPGTYVPIIDLNKCEGKGPCVPACPYDVLAMDLLPKEQRSVLSVKAKIKGIFHGWERARVVADDACRACGVCVSVCPEHAITLGRTVAP